MSILKQEFKLAISSLLRLPGFSLTVITTLAATLAALAVVININYIYFVAQPTDAKVKSAVRACR
ncbi:hypothetical protein C1E23_01480 [Pseudoalteromonas phenolica]|uniref:Uncharacterized protein n=1 Tax=Pseudoalteromonas phenolica TaxID=161398 RepID=A0A4Q7ITC9_9GAMM|nr:hypothetical protein [Pseudoalteromonas phenolica]RZQ54876.1 hypothetical protein C1E23_01480 [Pseudoalteromonas phenolica]